MADRLAGKVVCISGIGRGQGRAAALLFAREGATIVVCDMNAEEAEATAKEVRASGGALGPGHGRCAHRVGRCALDRRRG